MSLRRTWVKLQSRLEIARRKCKVFLLECEAAVSCVFTCFVVGFLGVRGWENKSLGRPAKQEESNAAAVTSHRLACMRHFFLDQAGLNSIRQGPHECLSVYGRLELGP